MLGVASHCDALKKTKKKGLSGKWQQDFAGETG
jgi:hypothetical protein